jgi:hypothetical protein
VIGLALAGGANEFGSPADRFRRSGLMEFAAGASLAADRCPSGKRHIGLGALAESDWFAPFSGECQPATGGVAANATPATAQAAARKKSTRALRSGEENRRGDIGRSLGGSVSGQLASRTLQRARGISAANVRSPLDQYLTCSIGSSAGDTFGKVCEIVKLYASGAGALARDDTCPTADYCALRISD